MPTRTERITWTTGDMEFEGHAVWRGDEAKPAVLVCHAWSGPGDVELTWVEALAGLGYVGVAIDVYGVGRRGSNPAESEALMMPLLENRDVLQNRLLAALAAVRGMKGVDATRVAAIGFCFGGLCALDLARSGADVRGVVSFHGLFRPSPLEKRPIQARILALHGYDDPMVKPEAMVDLCNELTEADADWQLHTYGGTMHAFTNPVADDPERGTVFSARANARSQRSAQNFLAEVLV